jgi:hypothetical protein
MKYQIEFPGNPDCIYVHVDIYLANQQYPIYGKEESDSIRVLFDAIEAVKGVDYNQGNCISRYHISVYIAKAFDRVKVGTEIAKVVQQWGMIYNLVDPLDTLEQLPILRSDIRQVKCKECEKEQERMMREVMQDWERLDREG